MQGLTRKWVEPPPTNPTHTLRTRILEARGYATAQEQEAFLNPKLLDLEDPDSLPGATEAGALLATAVREGKKIIIFGDYDADGITAATILHKIMGAAIDGEGPAVYIPDRIDEGYGISVQAMETFASQGVDVVISVDCGVTAVEAAAKAKELGMTLIVTDHHKPREDGKLPDCAVIVHPGLESEATTPLAGVGVAYQVAWAFARAWSESRSVNERLKQTLLDAIPLVAIGTIADMVPLEKGNRIFARWGLQLLPSTSNPGLLAIMKELDTPKKKVRTSDVSFGIAPVINAVGRLSHAARAVDLLTHLQNELATGTAKELLTINRKRQAVQRKIIQEALELYEEQQLADSPMVILQNDSWERGVVGVAAGKCIETHYKPTILLSGSGDELVGSARSIQGFSIFDALCACKEHLVTFGGHDMAAGLTVHRESYDAFVSSMNQYAKETLSPELLIKKIQPDVMADIVEITTTSAIDIEKIGPFGIGNPAPVVQVMSVKISDVRTMGANGAHLSFKAGRKRLRCVWWGHGSCSDTVSNGSRIDIVGKIKVNEFRGNRTAEIDIQDIRLPSP